MSEVTNEYPLYIKSEDLDVPGAFVISNSGASIWRRLWFAVSCVPRYLISGSVEVP